MSKPRLKMMLKIDTLAHAATIRNSIVNQLAGKDIFEEHVLSHYVEDGFVYGIGEWRFNSSVDRDTVKDWLKDQVQNHPQVKNWVSEARITNHLCSHDDAEVKDCKTTEFLEWTK